MSSSSGRDSACNSYDTKYQIDEHFPISLSICIDLSTYTLYSDRWRIFAFRFSFRMRRFLCLISSSNTKYKCIAWDWARVHAFAATESTPVLLIHKMVQRTWPWCGNRVVVNELNAYKVRALSSSFRSLFRHRQQRRHHHHALSLGYKWQWPKSADEKITYANQWRRIEYTFARQRHPNTSNNITLQYFNTMYTIFLRSQ